MDDKELTVENALQIATKKYAEIKQETHEDKVLIRLVADGIKHIAEMDKELFRQRYVVNADH